jgi:ParB family chromosome partitioning protein
VKEFRVDPELRGWLPDLDDEESEGLEERILAEGIRDPLVVWRDFNVIVDGHHRYEIAQQHDLEFEVTYMDFDDKEAVKDWIDKNALARRNLSPDQAALLRGRVYNRRKARQGGTGANQYTVQTSQNDTSASTAATLAKEYGVSEPTIKRDGKYASAYDTLAPEIPDAFDSENRPSRQAVVEAGEQWKAGDKEAAAETLKRPHVANNSGENEWYTPPEYIEAARLAMGGIDLDPASSELANQIVHAMAYYTKDDDGLQQDWHGRVWLNPPYAQPLVAHFADKVAEEFEAGRIEQACILVNNATETAWFQTMLRAATAVCFPRGRVRFIDKNGNPSGAPLQGQAVLYFGYRRQSFQGSFSSFGEVLLV